MVLTLSCRQQSLCLSTTEPRYWVKVKKCHPVHFPRPKYYFPKCVRFSSNGFDMRDKSRCRGGRGGNELKHSHSRTGWCYFIPYKTRRWVFIHNAINNVWAVFVVQERICNTNPYNSTTSVDYIAGNSHVVCCWFIHLLWRIDWIYPNSSQSH